MCHALRPRARSSGRFGRKIQRIRCPCRRYGDGDDDGDDDGDGDGVGSLCLWISADGGGISPVSPTSSRPLPKLHSVCADDQTMILMELATTSSTKIRYFKHICAFVHVTPLIRTSGSLGCGCLELSSSACARCKPPGCAAYPIQLTRGFPPPQATIGSRRHGGG